MAATWLIVRTTANIIAIWNPYVAGGMLVYYAVETFYPGGWNGLEEDASDQIQEGSDFIMENISPYY